MRPGEVEGVDYKFRSKDEISELGKRDDFVTMNVHGDLQAINLEDVQKAVESGKQAIAEVSVDWAALLRQRYPDKVFSIFISLLSETEIQKRMAEQGLSRDQVIYNEMIARQKERSEEMPTKPEKQETRARDAVKEMARQNEYHAVIVSDTLRDISAHQDQWNGEEGKRIVDQFMALAKPEPVDADGKQSDPATNASKVSSSVVGKNSRMGVEIRPQMGGSVNSAILNERGVQTQNRGQGIIKNVKNIVQNGFIIGSIFSMTIIFGGCASLPLNSMAENEKEKIALRSEIDSMPSQNQVLTSKALRILKSYESQWIISNFLKEGFSKQQFLSILAGIVQGEERPSIRTKALFLVKQIDMAFYEKSGLSSEIESIVKQIITLSKEHDGLNPYSQSELIWPMERLGREGIRLFLKYNGDHIEIGDDEPSLIVRTKNAVLKYLDSNLIAKVMVEEYKNGSLSEKDLFNQAFQYDSIVEPAIKALIEIGPKDKSVINDLKALYYGIDPKGHNARMRNDLPPLVVPTFVRV